MPGSSSLNYPFATALGSTLIFMEFSVSLLLLREQFCFTDLVKFLLFEVGGLSTPLMFMAGSFQYEKNYL